MEEEGEAEDGAGGGVWMSGRRRSRRGRGSGLKDVVDEREEEEDEEENEEVEVRRGEEQEGLKVHHAAAAN